MKDAEKRAAVTAYRERKILGGVYRVSCSASGEMWVGFWSDLATIQNRLWFSLRQGASPNPAMQRAWQQHGAEQFQFEVLEPIEAPEDVSAPLHRAMLKDRATLWLARLKAKPV